MKASILNRKLHRWGAILTAAPLLVIIATGIVLQLKKDSDWVQPPTARSENPGLDLTFDRLLAAVRDSEEARESGIRTWDDVDRLDVRVARGVVKVRGKPIDGGGCWEVQVDTRSGEVLHVAYRRSDLIESLHDGSWFSDGAKLGIFLPTAVVLLGLWITGVYLWLLPHLARRKRASKHKHP